MKLRLIFHQVTPFKAYLLIGFFCFSFSLSFSQKLSYSDSLESVYRMGAYDKQEQLELLKNLSRNHPDPQKSLLYSSELINLAKQFDSTQALFIGYLQKGQSLRLKSDFSQALESFFEAVKIANEQKSNTNLGLVDIAIADVYSLMRNHSSAVSYYENGIELLRKEGDSLNFANGLSNLGDEYFTNKEYDKAIAYFMEAGLIFNKIESKVGAAFVLGNMGMVYAEQGKDFLAEANINEAIQILEELENYYPISVYLTYMSDIYLSKNKWKTALNYSKRSLDLAVKYGLKEQISEADLQLSRLHEKSGNYKEALSFYKDYTTYKDSVANIEIVQKIGNLEVAQKQAEVDLLIEQKKNEQIKVGLLNAEKKNQKTMVISTIIALVLIALLAFGLYRRNRYINKTKLIIEEEQKKSEALLTNILPEETALELKQNGKVQAKRFESVTVLFTDFIGFTSYANTLPPEKLVKSVDYYFSKFDSIIEKYSLEKIKTAGDSYMCAGGLPFPSSDHALEMTLAAFEIAQFVEDTKKEKDANIAHFDIRLGINTGPIIAGVVGTKKFSYDIWGDTVNVASRMESASEVGRINVAEETFQLIKNAFNCEYRGEIDVKNKGLMKMYFVNSIKNRTITNMSI
jgi:class 3 adenylate cyclase/Tfp pilus assembly protein PilF